MRQPRPMSSFVGRERELRVLEQAARDTQSHMIPIYGRRRVGKSTLLLHFLRERQALYLLGKQSSPHLQLAEFLQLAAQLVDEALLRNLPTDDWQGALEALTQRWRGPEKLILIFDELQWTVGSSPELPSVLQALWDRVWKPAGNVLLILCGSYIGFMEREVLGQESPLFGRRTHQIHLQPFDHIEARRFHPGWSLVDAAQARFICGGVPLYLESFDPQRSIAQNVQATLLDEFAPLYDEPTFLLREELRDVSSYHAILTALASGSRTAAEIAASTGLPERSLPYYLGQLEELRYLRRRYPLTDGPPVTRHVRYTLDDPLLRFWFRFVYPEQSLIKQLGPERTWDKRIAPRFDAWCGTSFEALCREALPHLYEREGVNAPFAVGEYWSTRKADAVQIDLVGHRQDGRTDLGECKWGAVSSAATVVAELRDKQRRYPNPRNATIGLRLFVREPLAVSDPDVRVHTLADLYGGGAA